MMNDYVAAFVGVVVAVAVLLAAVVAVILTAVVAVILTAAVVAVTVVAVAAAVLVVDVEEFCCELMRPTCSPLRAAPLRRMSPPRPPCSRTCASLSAGRTPGAFV